MRYRRSRADYLHFMPKKPNQNSELLKNGRNDKRSENKSNSGDRSGAISQWHSKLCLNGHFPSSLDDEQNRKNLK